MYCGKLVRAGLIFVSLRRDGGESQAGIAFSLVSSSFVATCPVGNAGLIGSYAKVLSNVVYDQGGILIMRRNAL